MFNLPDGRAQIAVSTRHGEFIDVQWRDPDGRTWSEPETVFSELGLEVSNVRVRVGGPTLALRAALRTTGTPDSGDDPSWVPSKTVFVVCRSGSCTTSDTFDGALDEAPQVAVDGRRVFLAAVDGTFVSWHDGGIESERPRGLPADGDGEEQPLMAPDGSLRVVRGTSRPRGCDYRLFTSDPGGADFTEAARFLDTGDRRPRCSTTLQTFSPDWIVVSEDDEYDVWFLARSGGAWSRVTEDPSGQVRYPRTGEPRLAGAFELSGFWHWRQVVATSPDGRRLLVQVHFPGAETWSEPQIVGEAPPGSECVDIAPKPTYTWDEEDPFYVHLTCRSRTSPHDPWTYVLPTAVTEDGRTWESFLATGEGIRTGRDLFFAGSPSHVWTPEAGLRELGLPVAAGDVVTPVADRGFVLGHLEPEAGGCRLVVRLAGDGDTTWSEPVPSSAAPLPVRLCRLDSASGENRNVYYYVGHTPRDTRMIRLVWRDGEPLVEDGPDIEG